MVCQSAEQASSEIWRAAGGGSAAQKEKSTRPRVPAGVSSLSAGVGALRLRLHQHFQAYTLRGSEGAGSYGEACLLLCCRLAGGTLMASPLDGPVFRLREEAAVVEDEEATTREASDGVRKVGAGKKRVCDAPLPLQVYCL